MPLTMQDFIIERRNTSLRELFLSGKAEKSAPIS